MLIMWIPVVMIIVLLVFILVKLFQIEQRLDRLHPGLSTDAVAEEQTQAQKRAKILADPALAWLGLAAVAAALGFLLWFASGYHP